MIVNWLLAEQLCKAKPRKDTRRLNNVYLTDLEKVWSYQMQKQIAMNEKEGKGRMIDVRVK